jgi:hypothetical protein
MTGELGAWARVAIGAGLLLLTCLLRDVISSRQDAASVSRVIRSRK